MCYFAPSYTRAMADICPSICPGSKTRRCEFPEGHPGNHFAFDPNYPEVSVASETERGRYLGGRRPGVGWSEHGAVWMGNDQVSRLIHQ